MKYNKVIIWGHKLHSHTHSYIHNGFYLAFKHLGIDVKWLDNFDNIEGIDFSDALFLTEGQVDNKIPVREDGIYITHNCTTNKYSKVKKRLDLQVYTDDVLKYNAKKLTDCTYFDGDCIWMPWATDLLPDEIEQNKGIVFNKDSVVVNWIGTIGGGVFGNENQIYPFNTACKENGMEFRKFVHKNVEENIQMVKDSYIAPTIVGEWQCKQGYIPCRIFKNISYGQFGITNSERVNELFGNKLVYNPNTYNLFYDAKNRLSKTKEEELYALMDEVKNKHTYLNRIETINQCLEC